MPVYPGEPHETVWRWMRMMRSTSPVLAVASLVVLLLAVLPGVSNADTWTVTIRAHELEALTNSDNWGEQDMYWKVHMKALVGTATPVDCDTVDNHPDDDNAIKVDWGCVMTLSGGPDATAEIVVEVYDEDTIGDDELDINIDHAQLGLLMRFEARTSRLEIVGNPDFTPARCMPGRIKVSGFKGGGDEPADLTFSLSASGISAVDGDSDGDGIVDSAEICGFDGTGDGTPDVNLPAMGADPARKDLFVEIDWMSAPGGAGAHGHEPWLPALVNAWNELNVAAVSNPTIGGVVKPGGIALHADVGTLFANYGFDTNGDGTPELPAGGPTAAGNIDLSGDGIPDIGNLGLLGGGLRLGGNVLAEDPVLNAAPTPPPPPGPPPLPTAALIFAPGSDFAAIKTANFDAARDRVFHYVVFAHAYPQVQGGPANSSGLAEPCVGGTPCNDVIVSLGGYARQTVDTNLDGIPDTLPPPAPPPPPPALINGPAGVLVDGTVRQHTGTLLHELGHNFRLQHGGGDGVNWKPNFLSVMNYHFQMTGLAYDWNADNNGDAVGVDFDGDGVQDLQRFQYSSFAGVPAMPALNEGLTPPPAGAPPVVSETTAPAPWSRVITRWSCPPVVTAAGPQPPVVNPGDIFQPINWDCAAGAATPVDINNVQLQSGVTEVLASFDDSNRLQNGGLDSDPTSGIGREEHRDLLAVTQRIHEPPGRQELVNKCVSPRRLDFEGHPRGTAIGGQFAPHVTFLADGLRTPRIAGPGERNGVPTASPEQSLLNEPRGGAVVPLAFTFGELQRVVQLSFGQAGLANAQREGVRAVIAAFDQDDLPMGRIVKPLPLPTTGITEPVTIAAVYPDQLIRRMEIRYEIAHATDPGPALAPLAEPVEIDDLVFCPRLDDSDIHPLVPAPPKFGDLPVTIDVRSEALMEVPGTGGEPGNTATIALAVTGLGVSVDGAAFTTDTSVTRPEGTTVKLVAQPTSSTGPFLYWRYDDGISFGRGVNAISVAMLRKATLTAVYQGRRHERPHEPDRPALLGLWEALRRCLLVDCLGIFRTR